MDFRIIAPRQTHLVIALALILVACSNPEEQKRRHFEQGNTYVEQKRDDFAVIEYANAVRIDPKFGEARLKLAETYERMNNLRAAFPEYIRAADSLPDNRDLQLKVLQLLLLTRQYEDAKARATSLLEKNPKDADVLLMRATAMAGLKDAEGALEEVQEALNAAPNRSDAFVSLGNIQTSAGAAKEAEAAFRRAIELQPSSANARLAFANFLWSARRPAEAEEQIKGAIAQEPNNVLANRMLATLYRATNRMAEAEAPLKVMADSSKTPAARFELAQYYVSAGREADARKLLTELASDPAAAARAETVLASMDYAQKRTKEAHARLDKVLERTPNDVGALVTKAQWLANENKLDDAFDRAKAAVNADPSSAPAHYTLGVIQGQRRNVAEAIKEHTEALRLNPRLALSQIELSRLNQLSGRSDAAVRYAEEAKLAAPGNIDARLALVRSLLTRNDRTRANEELAFVLRERPNSGAAHALNGILQALRNEDNAARASFTKSLELAPNNLEALGGLAALDVKAKQFDAAIRRVDAALAKEPNRVDLLTLSARVNQQAGRSDRAEQALRQAVTADPTYLAGYGMLAQIYITQRRLDEARVEFETIAKRNPRAVGARTMVGIILESQGKRAEAKRWYETLVAELPTAPIAANNLAFMYAEDGTNLDTALKLASAAKKELPNSPEVNDTLGWVYYKKDLPNLAIGPLEESVKQLPNRADILYHLGLTYAKLGEKAKSREALERALKLNPMFAGATTARKTLESL